MLVTMKEASEVFRLMLETCYAKKQKDFTKKILELSVMCSEMAVCAAKGFEPDLDVEGFVKEAHVEAGKLAVERFKKFGEKEFGE